MKFPYRIVGEITSDLIGLYRISHEAYHSGPGISSSKLKKALISYQEYSSKETYDSPSLAFGRAFHAALLEPQEFATKWVIQPEFSGHPNSGAYKTEKILWGSQNIGKSVVSKDDFLTITSMIASVKAHPEYERLGLYSHDAEIMGITYCKETEFHIKCKADLLGSRIVDFKTTSSNLSRSDFINEIIKWQYHVSAAFYQDIILFLTGERLPFLIVAVKKSGECGYFELSDEVMHEGRVLYKAALKRIRKWNSMSIDEREQDGKRLRVMNASARLTFRTAEILEDINA